MCGRSILTPVKDAPALPAVTGQQPGRFFWSASVDVTEPDAVQQLTAAVKQGAHGFDELKSHVQAGGPEMRRVYAAAAELNVPALIHFQDVETRPGDSYNMGFRDFEAVMKAFPRARFVGHASAFWAHISDEPVTAQNPTGKVRSGGVTDRLLSDYPNLLGDIRHQDNLHLGSDCFCTDGRGDLGGAAEPGS